MRKAYVSIERDGLRYYAMRRSLLWKNGEEWTPRSSVSVSEAEAHALVELATAQELCPYYRELYSRLAGLECHGAHGQKWHKCAGRTRSRRQLANAGCQDHGDGPRTN